MRAAAGRCIGGKKYVLKTVPRVGIARAGFSGTGRKRYAVLLRSVATTRYAIGIVTAGDERGLKVANCDVSLRFKLQDHRPCERWCPGLGNGGHWRHHSRFRYRKQESTHGSVCTKFDRLCRDCQQIERNQKKSEDRPQAIIKGRAQWAAHKGGISAEFFMVNMNYASLVEPLRALMGPKAICQCCGHRFENERDIQIDHIVPPHHERDWPRLHARNLRLSCAACNITKGTKAFNDWLEEQDGARLSNEQFNAAPPPINQQLSLWG